MILSEIYAQRLTALVIPCNTNHGKFPVEVEGGLLVETPRDNSIQNAASVQPTRNPFWAKAIYLSYEDYLKDFGHVLCNVMGENDCYHGTIYKFLDGMPAEVSLGWASSNRHQRAVWQGRREPELKVGRSPFIPLSQ